ncbi:alpha/beta fold hydrolase [Kitasatospora sp. NPDC091207]|uniref:alpha/beta fold hydrolase n=1 Tax=Kitasatospora sp. NPDC091207 TaxID=3364083 RepID=UPI0037FF2805
MTTFVLVSGPFTDGRVWGEVTTRLRESGAEVHPVTLTGLGDRRRPAGPDTGLETHIDDVVRLIDETDAPEVVIVGHDYGIHPVLGAADRRPERIARIVYLDAGMPQDGDVALQLVPDEEVRGRLLNPAGPDGDDGWIAPPAADGWQRWGSTAGLSEEALARLTDLASPQPSATFTQPLRLTGALAAVPTSGVFCTASGMSIAKLEGLMTLGMPQLKALADPRVGFFDLDTGHWPMLSRPDDLAELLLRAAAGGGHRLTAPPTEELPGHLRPFALDVPEQARERVGRVDLHLPSDLAEAEAGAKAGTAAEAGAPRPAVLFVHGGPVPETVRPTPRDWPTYVGHGQYAASQGVIGATLDHRLHSLADYPLAAQDIADAVELLRADPRVDGDRIALWFFSGGGPLSADWLSAPPSWLRCLAASYPILAPLPGWHAVDSRFRPATALAGAGRLPVVLTRVGLEVSEIAATVEAFVAAAAAERTDLEVIDVPHGHHGFDTLDPTDESREAIERAFRVVLGHLLP